MERLDGTILRKELPFELSARRGLDAVRARAGRRWSACTRSTCPPYPSWRRSAAVTGTSRARSRAGPTGSRGRRPTTSATGAGDRLARRAPARGRRAVPDPQRLALRQHGARPRRPAAGARRPRLGDGHRRRPADGSRRRARLLDPGRRRRLLPGLPPAADDGAGDVDARRRSCSWYGERTGLEVTPEQWRFYEVFGLFRLGVICQQIWYRYFHGQTHNEAYARFGPAVAYLECAAAR